jgi:NitT/TauT family transport system ATP-binding protein
MLILHWSVIMTPNINTPNINTKSDYTVGETILRINNVNAGYGEKPILKDLNAEIHNIIRPGKTQGQVVGLLGPSGVGKTTLFKLLAGLKQPDSGEILADGKPIERGTVGVVAQQYPLFAHRTVLGNLVVAGQQAGLSGSICVNKAKEMLARFGIDDQANKYPSQLSGGQRQRVAISQQFMCSDHFLLMDEPFSGLDLIAIEKVSQFIREIAASDELKTIVIVTHDIDAAMTVCDTLWMMGRDRDAQGNLLPGARIQKIYDLAAAGLAWQENISTRPDFLQLLAEIKAAFVRL